MLNYQSLLLILILFFGLQSCSTVKVVTSESKVTGTVEQFGLINGFPAGTKNVDGSLAYCETSAVINLGDRLLIASDKPAPNSDVSAAFSIQVESTFPSVITDVKYETSPVLNNSTKIESMAKSPATDLFFAATAFDRIKTDSPEWDTYNRLVYWEGENPENARVLLKSEDQGIVSSKNIREALHRVIRNRKYPNGVSYFKIEGLAVLKDNSILFGVRELGPNYENFDYTFTILSTSFIQSSSGIVINPDWKKVFEFTPSRDTRINKNIGLSGIEYHEATNSLIALTSYEKEGEASESFLWVLPMEKRLSYRTKPILMMGEDGKPLTLPFKAEGLTFLNKNTLFIICDEDRMATKVITNTGEMERKPHQGVFAIIKIKS